MFARGSRFEITKASDVPAPNAYNIPQESILDTYKRGAFLDKADRFNKDMIEPAPETRKASPTQAAAERYAALQKRVDELEKVHRDGKRNHSFELERLKQDLAASQKSAAEAAQMLEKEKKQRSALESTIQELKKVSLSDQGEIKDLRHKLRLLEMERDKSSSKQREITVLKNSLQALEIKRKDDVRERDQKVVELEKNLQGEKKKRELLENRNLDACRLLQEEIENLRTALQEKDNLLQATTEEFRIAKEKFQQVNAEEEEQLQRLQQHRSLLETVVKQYGTLASQSISLAQFNHLKQDYATLQCRQYRLERKLANSEGQVVELTHLIRQTMEQNIELDQQLRDALEHVSLLSHPSSSSYLINLSETDDCSCILADIDKHLREEQSQLSDVTRDTNALLSTYYRLKSDQLHSASSVLAKEHSETVVLLEQREGDLSSALASHEVLACRLESMQKDRMVDQEALQKAIDEKEKLRSSNAMLDVQLADANQKLGELDSIHAAVLKKEKEAVQRLTTTIQKSRMAEVALRGDIDRLTTELANAEGYQDAYSQLYEQVNLLIAKNHLAEEEAERISKFNAQILGHNNPAQRIMYVDRIRTELAEAKMRIAELACEQEALATQNGELEHELHMYKSVRVDGLKPRTNITRIARPPLVNLTQSLNTTLQSTAHAGTMKPSLKIAEPLHEVSHADMTLDEIW